ncbi:acyloxyacyl hydrolase [Mucilaginibacter robiniae]|uniref:Acyloxyacyl hydrolase n=1 Tax=Mucilaginibacter robiniae TaxID=2728022 RepID=A0A7L5DV01_9SPHI|nr:acyloxyacyl hydrolase [Mucilaginibacter robiniae]QJD94955.1 acyloxyacyl hydrolase [Mucilaginibacter robiniae]
MRLKVLLCALLCAFVIVKAQAQDSKNSVEITPTAGIKIFSAEKNYLKGKFWGTELAYHFNMENNPASYVRIFNIKSIDAVVSYRNMEQVVLNSDPSTKGLLGSTVGVLGRFEFGLLKAGPVQLLFTPGAGLIYSTQTYFTDNKNPIVGSHINIAAQAGLKLFTAITPSTGIQGGIDILHYSNGATRLPNNGVNAYMWSLGLVQKVNQRQSPRSDNELNIPKNSIELGGDIGYRGVFKSKDGHFKSGLYLGYNYRLSKILSLKIGADAGYFYTVFDPSNFVETFQYYGSSYDRWRVGISAGVDVWLGRLAVMANYGHYIHYRTYFPDNQKYWTAGLKYKIKPWVALQVKGYIHGTEADYVGVGPIFNVHW